MSTRTDQLLNDVVTAARAVDKASAELDAAGLAYAEAVDATVGMQLPATAVLTRLALANIDDVKALDGLRIALAALDAHDRLALHQEVA